MPTSIAAADAARLVIAGWPPDRTIPDLLRAAAIAERTEWTDDAVRYPRAYAVHMALADLLDTHATQVADSWSAMPNWSGRQDWALTALPGVAHAVVLANAVLVDAR